MDVMNVETVVVEVAKLELHPDDVLVVKVTRALNDREIETISHTLNAVLPKDVKAVIIPPEYEIEVIRKI